MTVAAPLDRPLQACPLCASPAIRWFDLDTRGASIWKCGCCGVKFMNPQYTDEYLREYYATYVDEGTAWVGQPRERRTRHKTQNLELIERFVRPGRFLSIGCGDGVELEVAKARGWRVEGYDVDPVTTARVAKTVGCPIHTGDLFALPLDSNGYDCVYLDQVIEHPKRPAAYLELCHRILRPGGVLYLGMPNIAGLSSSFKTLLGRVGLKRKRRGRHYDTFHHLFYYSPGMLRPLLERRFGFRVITVLGDPKPRQDHSLLGALHDRVVRRVPQLDSSFVVLATK